MLPGIPGENWIEHISSNREIQRISYVERAEKLDFSKIVNFQKFLPELVVTSGAYTLILRPGMDLTLSITVCWQTVLPERHQK